MSSFSNITGIVDNITSSINTFLSKRLKSNEEKANDYAEKLIEVDDEIISLIDLPDTNEINELVEKRKKYKTKFNKYD